MAQKKKQDIPIHEIIPTNCMSEADTPWKINMEPTNHPSGKENDLPNLYDYVPC